MRSVVSSPAGSAPELPEADAILCIWCQNGVNVGLLFNLKILNDNSEKVAKSSQSLEEAKRAFGLNGKMSKHVGTIRVPPK